MSMSTPTGWTRDQLLVAFNLYCQIPFGKITSRHPDIVAWAQLIGRTPAALSMKMGNIASLDPAITSTGRSGLENASAADRAMWEEMEADWDRFAIEVDAAAGRFGAPSLDDVALESADLFDEIEDYTGTDRAAVTKVRIGQAFFRRAVLSAYDYQCCITGLAVPSLLVASHIMPWRVDAANRRNPRNGLCLSSLHDRAFDAGILTISEEMTVRISADIADPSGAFFESALKSYNGKPVRLPERFQPDLHFLSYHREHVFRA